MSGSNAVTAPNEDAPGYPGWRVTFASATGVFVGFASLLVYTFGVLLKPLAAEFSWSRQAVSLAFGFAAMSVAATSPIIGVLLDRYGPRRVILPCLTVFGCAFASLSLLTPRIWHLYAVFTVLGMVGNGTAQMAYSRAVSTWFTRRRGLALAILMSGGAVGAMVLPPLAQTLIHAVGWRYATAVLGGMVLVLGLPVAGFAVREKPGSRHAGAPQVEGSTVSASLRSRAFWILVAVLFLASISQNASITHLPALLTDRGVGAEGAAIALSSLGAAILLGRLATGWLLDRFFAPRVAICLLTLAALGVFLLSTAHSLATGLVAVVLIGAGMGGEGDVTPYLLAKYFGLKSFATLYGFTWTAYAVAGAIGPVLMGNAFDSTGSYGPFLLLLAAVSLGAAALMFLLPAYPSSGAPRERSFTLTEPATAPAD
jgi:predicted MFS family arabinose efflux permease